MANPPNASDIYDSSGRQIIKTIPNTELTVTSDMTTITGTTTGSTINFLYFNKATFHIISGSVTSGATVKIQSSLDNTNWADIATKEITSDTVTEVAIENRKYIYLRPVITPYTDGTFTIKHIFGN